MTWCVGIVVLVLVVHAADAKHGKTKHVLDRRLDEEEELLDQYKPAVDKILRDVGVKDINVGSLYNELQYYHNKVSSGYFTEARMEFLSSLFVDLATDMHRLSAHFPHEKKHKRKAGPKLIEVVYDGPVELTNFMLYCVTFRSSVGIPVRGIRMKSLAAFVSERMRTFEPYNIYPLKLKQRAAGRINMATMSYPVLLFHSTESIDVKEAVATVGEQGKNMLFAEKEIPLPAFPQRKPMVILMLQRIARHVVVHSDCYYNKVFKAGLDHRDEDTIEMPKINAVTAGIPLKLAKAAKLFLKELIVLRARMFNEIQREIEKDYALDCVGKPEHEEIVCVKDKIRQLKDHVHSPPAPPATDIEAFTRWLTMPLTMPTPSTTCTADEEFFVERQRGAGTIVLEKETGHLVITDEYTNTMSRQPITTETIVSQGHAAFNRDGVRDTKLPLDLTNKRWDMWHVLAVQQSSSSEEASSDSG